MRTARHLLDEMERKKKLKERREAMALNRMSHWEIALYELNEIGEEYEEERARELTGYLSFGGDE